MNITVFGANGNIGTRVVSLLLRQGHSVTAFTHGPLHLAQNSKLSIIEGDIYNSEDVERALMSAQIVISTLGSWGTKNKDILTAGMKNVVPAMEKNGVKRIVSLTGAGALLPQDHLTWYDRLVPLLLKVVAPKILRDGEEHIKILANSTLNWTVIRSPIMKDGPAKGYKIQANPALPWKRICRDDVAAAIVDIALSNTHFKAAPFVQ